MSKWPYGVACLSPLAQGNSMSHSCKCLIFSGVSLVLRTYALKTSNRCFLFLFYVIHEKENAVVKQHVFRVIIHTTKCKTGYVSDVYYSVQYFVPWKLLPLECPAIFCIFGCERSFSMIKSFQNMQAVTTTCNQIFLLQKLSPIYSQEGSRA